MSTSVKRPGDLPEPNDNPHPYTDFDDLEIESYIATDEKKHKLFMDIENQIAEVIERREPSDVETAANQRTVRSPELREGTRRCAGSVDSRELSAAVIRS